MTEQRGDDVDWGVVVEVFGGEHPPAVVRQQPQRGAVRVPGAGCQGQVLQSSPDRLDRHRARVPGPLQQVRCCRQWCLGDVVTPVAGRDRTGPVEALDVADDLGDHPAEAIADRDNPRPIVFRWFDVQQVVDLPVG